MVYLLLILILINLMCTPRIKVMILIICEIDPGAGTYHPKNNFVDKVLTKNNTNKGFCFNKLTRD